MRKGFTILFFIFLLSFPVLGSQSYKMGADRMDVLLPLLRNQNIALVVNHTSLLGNGTHLLDTLLASGIEVKKIFAPEHGFRGDADAGETIVNGKDAKTGLPMISLYGRIKKPTPQMLGDVDIVIFDIQDVGARFYTYITTMHRVMDACAENGKKFIVLDRPNPHDFIDGPVLERKYKSFVGTHPIPVLHGLTVGELAQMINGEKWLTNGRQCDLEIVKTEGWKHGDKYSLPVKPSPNLPNDQSIRLYASLCFFEATNISVGRGTYFPFQVVGFPNSKYGTFSFTPESLKGFDTNPMHRGKKCYGIDLREENFTEGMTLSYLISFYRKSGLGVKFFKSPQFMNMLAGTNRLQQQIIAGKNEKDIRETWQKPLNEYKEMRKKYLLYEDTRF